MRKTKLFLVAVVATFLVGASASQAMAGTMSGSITDGTNVNCAFSNVSYSGTPSTSGTVTVSGASLQAGLIPNAGTPGCDPTSINSISDIDVTFAYDAGSSSYQATLDSFTVDADVAALSTNCAFVTDPTDTNLPGPSSINGPYTGAASANGEPGGSFLCYFASPTFTVTASF